MFIVVCFSRYSLILIILTVQYLCESNTFLMLIVFFLNIDYFSVKGERKGRVELHVSPDGYDTQLRATC